ncbi:hypothetical protein [Clostridium sp. D53t1_180928_C8]|uniref:hypothetical protein n=1 Tax=Clostridium sp. D53t1_180928_C8 TaxID=2787101 RepID=UPI0018A96CF6|nr:hypothetical protein [Clostridium sp. D53t1_180928_C8]
MSKRLSLVGNRFGKLVVIEFSHTTNGYTYWNCICDCGTEITIKGSYLTSKTKATKSCGCLVKEKVAKNLPEKRNTSHKMSGTKFYGVWNSMVMRCHNPNSSSYSRYGEKGITVSNEWRVFQNFYNDMHSTYKEGLTIDRIDNTKGYSKENCRWVTMKVQGNNKSTNHNLNYKGKTYSLAEASEKFNIPYNVLKRRIYLGWSIEKALTAKVRKGKVNEI